MHPDLTAQLAQARRDDVRKASRAHRRIAVDTIDEILRDDRPARRRWWPRRP